jgi:superfamily I DNA/RNA helicase
VTGHLWLARGVDPQQVCLPDDFPGANLETLSVNFRSGPVLDVANAVIASGSARAGAAAQLRPRRRLRGQSRAFLSAHQVDEADEIARRIAEGGEPWSQYAVLARQRSLFDPIYRAHRSRHQRRSRRPRRLRPAGFST